MTKLKPARCIHVQHKKSTERYRLKGGRETINYPVIIGYNNVQHRYEICDEGFISTNQRIKRLTQED